MSIDIDTYNVLNIIPNARRNELRDILRKACIDNDVNIIKAIIFLTEFNDIEIDQYYQYNSNLVYIVMECIIDSKFTLHNYISIKYAINNHINNILQTQPFDKNYRCDIVYKKFTNYINNGGSFDNIDISFIKWIYPYIIEKKDQKTRMIILDNTLKSENMRSSIIVFLINKKYMQDLLYIIKIYNTTFIPFISFPYSLDEEQFMMVWLIEQNMIAIINIQNERTRHVYNLFVRKCRLSALAPKFDQEQRYAVGNKLNTELVHAKPLLTHIGEFLG